MMICEKDRQVTIDQIRNGEGASIARRLGINLKPAPTRDAKPRLNIGHPVAITISLALQGLSHRLDRVEQIHATNKANLAQGGQAPQGQPQQIIAAAAHRAATFQAERYAEKVDQGIAEHHAEKAEEAHKAMYGDPREPRQSDPPVDDRYQHMKFDPSVGKHSQKSEQFPMGDSNFVTPQQAKAMFESHEREQKARRAIYENECAKNRSFNANQHAMIKEIQAINDKAMKERWK